MNIAVILVHNKSDQANFDQVADLMTLIETKMHVYEQYDEENQTAVQVEVPYYTLKGLTVPHQVQFFQIIPFGVTPPANLHSIDSHKVFYGAGDEDKTGDHPRFFNWGLKRATDYGADIVLHIEDIKKLNFGNLKLDKITNKQDPIELIEDAACKVSSLRLLREVGQLDESKNKGLAIAELKQRMTGKGLRYG